MSGGRLCLPLPPGASLGVLGLGAAHAALLGPGQVLGDPPLRLVSDKRHLTSHHDPHLSVHWFILLATGVWWWLSRRDIARATKQGVEDQEDIEDLDDLVSIN